MTVIIDRPQTQPTDFELQNLTGVRCRLAIVGSVDFVDPEAWGIAERIIREEIEKQNPQVCISGGARGIDTWFKDIAIWYGYSPLIGNFIEYLPKNARWAPRGYKDRNRLIAEDCTRLVAIRCHASKTYGSGWTADYAEKIGKEVRREIL